MARFEYGTKIQLARHESAKLPDVRGTTLRVTRGRVWVTQEHDIRDVVLNAGETWTVERDGLTIVEAQEHANVWVAGRKIDARPADPPPGWMQRVRESVGNFLTPTRTVAPYV